MSAAEQRGFHRVIEAAKGLKKLADWLDGPEAPEVTIEEGQEPKPCARIQARGWRCIRTGKHTECVLEQVK